MRQLFCLLIFAIVLLGKGKAQQHVWFETRGEELVSLAFSSWKISENGNTGLCDSSGKVRLYFAAPGNYQVQFQHIGYYPRMLKVSIPASDTFVRVLMQPEEEDLEEVVVTSTRTNDKSSNNPTQIEVISGEEIQERSLDKPSSISHVLREQSGIQMLRTSSASGMFNFRFQGLNGKYVQVLRDGLPLFGGLSNTLGIAQISPLDLKQVELIRGPASTLYGGDAITGVINLISATPTEKPVRDLLFNIESTRAIDVAAFLMEKFGRLEYTFSGSYRHQTEKDWNNDNFTDYPKIDRFLLNPSLGVWLGKNEKTKLKAGVYLTREIRKGGSMQSVRGEVDSLYQYLETHTSLHVGGTLQLNAQLLPQGTLQLKHAINTFDRSTRVNDSDFSGKQIASLSELNFHFQKNKHDLVAGLDFRTDAFREKRGDPQTGKRDYLLLTAGAFAQYRWNLLPFLKLETGLRADYNTTYHWFVLPHVAWMANYLDVLEVRARFGMGYKLPTLFQEFAEEVNFKGILPVSKQLKAEQSYGASLDLQFKKRLESGWQFTATQHYFYTRIPNPVSSVEVYASDCRCGLLDWGNTGGYYDSKGMDTKLGIHYRGFGLGLGYALTDPEFHRLGNTTTSPLTAMHQVSMLAGYELFGVFTIGVDAYYFSPPHLSDGTMGRAMWELGVNTQLALKYVVVFANLENILDQRQSIYGDLVKPSPTYSQPVFAEVYAPLEGTIFNVGVKVKLGSIGKTKAAEKD